MKVAVDRGGTFTDLYAWHKGEVYVEKLLSLDPENYEDAPREGIRRLLERIHKKPIPSHEVPWSEIEWVRMGTTVATNALLEREGVPTALLITEGFKDLLEIGFQNRPKLFELAIQKRDMLYKKVVEIKERVLFKEEIFHIETPLDEAHTRMQLKALAEEGIESLAIVLLHAYGFTDHCKRRRIYLYCLFP